MKRNLLAIVPLLASITSLSMAEEKPAAAPQTSEGFISIFDGKSLENWDGDPRLWRVEDGCIKGETTAEVTTAGNTFLTWTAGELDDFELTLEYKIMSGNSGVQVRSFPIADKKWVVGGYQADFEAGDTYSGIIYGEQFRGILAERGKRTVVDDTHKVAKSEEFAVSAELQKNIKKQDWNTMRVVGKGWTVSNYINGQLTAEVTDEDKQMRRRQGVLALQVHAGPPMTVYFRNIKIKRLPLVDVKKIVFAAGNPSHGPGDHEHRAGCMLLANSLTKHFGEKVLTTVYTGGWPKDPSALQNADALVMYADGGGGHPANMHLAEIQKEVERGMGVGCIHYAVETVTGPPGEHFLKWMGGYFEADWSVNPHWDAEYKDLPKHAVTNGVQPFKINDEWYYHMRFRPEMKGVTPILSALPPVETLSRPDGPHSGNPSVREAVKNGEPQHMMWVSENENKSRGFGFTGGHFHRNWKDDNFRRVVLNAIAWISQAEVPATGVPLQPLSAEEAEANQDDKGQKKKPK